MTIFSAVQFSTHHDIEENFSQVEYFLRASVQGGAKCVVFPEEFLTLSVTPEEKKQLAAPSVSQALQIRLGKLAKHYQVWIVGGTLPVQADDSQKYYSRCIVWDDHGERVAQYDKIHLFDVEVGEKETYRESEFVNAGQQITMISTPFGKMGIAICYDIRFPELFRYFALQGVEIIVLPSAFTKPTGKVHWEILLRARAIENLSYVIAPNQVGMRSNGVGTYGHSLIMDPWGEIIARAEEKPTVIFAEIALTTLKNIRDRFPALTHYQSFIMKRLSTL